MPRYLHNQIQDYVVEVLRHYGFDARKEYWVGDVRFDVAGKCAQGGVCRGLSIAVEVSATSDLAREIDRLMRSGFDLKFVVSLKPYEPPATIGDVKVVRVEEFESALRRALEVPPSYPTFRSRPSEFRPLSRSLDEFKETLRRAGLHELLGPSLELILKVHALGEVPTKVVRLHLWSQQEFTTYYEDFKVVETLRQMGVIGEGSRGTYADGKVFLASLLKRGEEIAQQLAISRIYELREEIGSIVDKYGPIIPFLVATSNPISIEATSYRKALERGRLWSHSWAYELARRCGLPIEVTIFTQVTTYLPRVHSTCIKLLEEFAGLGLAFKGESYGSGGQFIGEKMGLIPELADLIVEEVRDEALRALEGGGLLRRVNEVVAAYHIGDHSIRRVELSQQDYERLLAKLGVSTDGLESLFGRLHSKGATSKLLDDPPFVIVLDKELLIEELAKMLEELEGRLLREGVIEEAPKSACIGLGPPSA